MRHFRGWLWRGRAKHPKHPAADLLRGGVEVNQDPGSHPLAFAHEPEQEVLSVDVVMAEAQRLAKRELEHLLDTRRERDLTFGRLFPGTDDPPAVLCGVVLNAAVGWWWADPLSALVILAYGVREARHAWARAA
jgi:hypothetical protein